MKLIIDEFGNRFWHDEFEHLYREDGPAIEWSNGEKTYCLNNITYTYHIWFEKTKRFLESPNRTEWER